MKKYTKPSIEVVAVEELDHLMSVSAHDGLGGDPTYAPRRAYYFEDEDDAWY